MDAPPLTIGIEEEYQIVDAGTRELRPRITEILGGDPENLLGHETVKPELHASTVEVATPVCGSVQEARRELARLRRDVSDLARSHGLEIVAAGTHPFSDWQNQEITPLERYRGIREDMAELAHRMLAFGLHVHIGVEDRKFLVEAMNVARYFLPHLLCLSTSSPFWSGRETGLKSYRSVVWENFPRTGIPPYIASWTEYRDMVDTLVATGCMSDGTKIWWDVRPNWNHPTIEFRVCDVCTRVDEAICVAALLQALVARLWRLRQENLTFRTYPKSLTEENKWRAVRYGVEGDLIDFARQEERPAAAMIEEFVDGFLGGVLDDLGIREEAECAHRILDEGTSADRQLGTYREAGDLEACLLIHISEPTRRTIPSR
ncbi:MAG: carboxylate-amine ligase, partial [Gemmatimonadota bacterium]